MAENLDIPRILFTGEADVSQGERAERILLPVNISNDVIQQQARVLDGRIEEGKDATAGAYGRWQQRHCLEARFTELEMAPSTESQIAFSFGADLRNQRETGAQQNRPPSFHQVLGRKLAPIGQKSTIARGAEATPETNNYVLCAVLRLEAITGRNNQSRTILKKASQKGIPLAAHPNVEVTRVNFLGKTPLKRELLTSDNLSGIKTYIARLQKEAEENFLVSAQDADETFLVPSQSDVIQKDGFNVSVTLPPYTGIRFRNSLLTLLCLNLRCKYAGIETKFGETGMAFYEEVGEDREPKYKLDYYGVLKNMSSRSLTLYSKEPLPYNATVDDVSDAFMADENEQFHDTHKQDVEMLLLMENSLQKKTLQPPLFELGRYFPSEISSRKYAEIQWTARHGIKKLLTKMNNWLHFTMEREFNVPDVLCSFQTVSGAKGKIEFECAPLNVADSSNDDEKKRLMSRSELFIVITAVDSAGQKFMPELEELSVPLVFVPNSVSNLSTAQNRSAKQAIDLDAFKLSQKKTIHYHLNQMSVENDLLDRDGAPLFVILHNHQAPAQLIQPHVGVSSRFGSAFPPPWVLLGSIVGSSRNERLSSSFRFQLENVPTHIEVSLVNSASNEIVLFKRDGKLLYRLSCELKTKRQ